MVDKLISHYKIIKKLGEGGMGEVYLAEDTELNRKVALKFLPSHQATEPEIQSRFKREAKAIAALNHPNIITIYEIDKYEDRFCIVMEYVEGESLEKLISQKKLSIHKVIDIVGQICEGLQAAHQNEIVHRDIKPANILLEKTDRVKIVDFGLAKLKNMTKLTKESSTLGTLSYMSPEQIQNENVDQRSDIFSLGVVFYEMITGLLPFRGDYDAAITYSILNEEPEPVARYKSGISDEIQRIVNKALSKDRNTRYQSAGDFLADLIGASNASSKNTGRRQKSGFPLRRFFLLGVGLLIAFVIITTIFFDYISIFQSDKSTSNKIKTTGENRWQSSIAVLPFENMSPDPDQEYFCDGMTEQIITNLSQLKNIKVISRTSVMKYKDTKKTLSEIAEELGVATILEGSVRKSDNRIRVTAKLLKADEVFNLWENDYDRKLQDVFAVQDDVSEEIAKRLLNKLTVTEEKNLRLKGTKNVQAYEYYLQGVYFHVKKYWITRRIEDLNKSERMFKKAIEHDSTYALAYAGLADLYNEADLYNAFSRKDDAEYVDLQELYINKAFKLNPYSAYINQVKAYVHEYKNEYDKAYDSFKKALELNPNESTINYDMGFFLSKRGLHHQADKYYAKAAELDPVSFKNYRNRGIISFNLGKLSQAVKYLQKALEFEYEDIPTRLWLARSFMLLGKYKKTEEQLTICESIKPGPQEPAVMKTRALLQAINGRKEEALSLLEVSGFTDRYSKISVYSLLGFKDEAIRLLDNRPIFKRGNIYESDYIIMLHNHLFDFIRETNEFQEALQKAKIIYEENLIKYEDVFL